MPSLLAALSTLRLARRAVMYAGGSWGFRDDFPTWRGRLETLGARRISHVIVAGDARRAHFLPHTYSLKLCVPHVRKDVAARLRDRGTIEAAAGRPARVLFVGGINAPNGIRELLHAACALSGVEFRLVGQAKDEELTAEITAEPAERSFVCPTCCPFHHAVVSPAYELLPRSPRTSAHAVKAGARW